MLTFARQIDTALPTMLCAARTQVFVPHYLLGVPELSKLQSAGSSSEAAAAGTRVFRRSVNV